MIEVEKKFDLTDEEEARLVQGAVFAGERTFTDIYYDTVDYALTRNDRWLRARSGKFEFKVSLLPSGERLGDRYDEITDEAEIRKLLAMPATGSFAEDLAAHGYAPFCVCTTVRRTYRSGLFTIDSDRVTYANDSLVYRCVEIELMVSRASEVQDALDRIFAFARGKGLEIRHVRGKIVQYLKERRPAHYATLRAAGIVKDF